MTAIITHLHCLLFVLSFILIINSTNSRYLNYGKIENDLVKQTNSTSDTVQNRDDEDVDLETFIEDYYDDLWQYLETWSQYTGKIKKKEEATKKPAVFADYGDYMSDMAVAEPEVDGKKFKGLSKDSMVMEKENFTWPFGFNRSSNDDLPESVRANRESNSQEEFPLRSKEMRLKSIIDQVLSFRGGNPRSNESIPDAKQYNALREIYEKNIKKIKSEEWTSSYTEKVQSFYPSCDIPRNTDEDVWSDPSSMNLLFDLEYPNPLEDSTIMIVSAKLRLYKLPQENYSLPNADAGAAKIKSERFQNAFSILPGDDDRQIRVSVYWYTRSLRRNRVKKKLLDSQMLSVYAPKWVEFNIRPAVRTWKESGKNFGLVVNVEDEDGALLPAEQYIHSMNCSKWTATVRPIPSIVMDRVNQYFIENLSENKNESADEIRGEEDRHKIYPYQPLLFPIIDLCTREVPISDVKSISVVNSAKKALEFNLLNLTRRGLNSANDSFSMFLKKNNLDLKEISRLQKSEKSVPKKPEAKPGEGRVSNFRNVPIGSPSTSQNGVLAPINKKSRGLPDDHRMELENAESGSEKAEERDVPRIRHNRKQWEMFQKQKNSEPRVRHDFNATDHH